MTQNSTTSKRFTASDTDTRSNRWFRLARSNTDLADLENLMDLYWGGPERRITGLTVRIIAVNAAALIMLLVGILYLGQYQRGLIAAKLETFGAEVELVAAAISEGATYEQTRSSADIIHQLSASEARRMVYALSETMGRRIYLFSHQNELIADSHKLVGPDGVVQLTRLEPPKRTLYSVEILKKMAGFILKFLPDRRVLLPYPETDSTDGIDYPGVEEALKGDINIAAWNNDKDKVFLTAAAPVLKDGNIIGAIFVTREGHDIESEIGEVWISIVKAFLITLVITALLSIYLSGVIARPLRRLANAAEDVRQGKESEIPDLSSRHDEIGELSMVLRDMTKALWDRMDSIERFAADVSHELKNPLTSLRSAVETASIVKTPADRDKLMEIIREDIARLDRLISDISNVSRLDTELSREAFERVDLKKLMNDLIDVYKDPLKRSNKPASGWDNRAQLNNNLQIILESSSAEDVFIWGLDGRLTQVFQNLIANALSFSPPGGSVRIHVTPLRKRVMITVEDQGPGIPENKLETIFERFYSERPDHEAYGRHSGLGLSICRQIIEAINGRIFAENIRNEDGTVTGARFTVILNMA